ncbi:MAG: DUF47 family protein [Candidatus Adiutrix sp.]|jgi:uncharacterized protein Yka (UPF0111/DUF47 family)|nr:DUF47 family protein [Candidatus Adiutrix sp.]
MFNALLPKGAPFFEFLLQQNQFLCTVSAELVNIFEGGSDEGEQKISKLEADADRIHLTITRHLSRAFITPIDREDILRINNAQEEIIDRYNNLTDRFHVLDLTSIPPSMLQLAIILKLMAPLLRSMLEGLSKKKDSHNTRQFLALRDECERLLRMGIKDLYEVEKLDMEALLAIVKWARAYDRMEEIVDHMVTLFEAIEEAVLKHA